MLVLADAVLAVVKLGIEGVPDWRLSLDVEYRVKRQRRRTKAAILVEPFAWQIPDLQP